MKAKLLRIVTKGKKRLGRGYGSGKGGHTSSRGQKGQKARDRIHPLFEGTKVKKSLIQRLPLQRGKGKLKSLQRKPIVVNLKYLNLLVDNSVVDLQLLIKEGIVDKGAQKLGVKILGEGDIAKKLTIKLPISTSAAEKIKKAGGKVDSI